MCPCFAKIIYSLRGKCFLLICLLALARMDKLVKKLMSNPELYLAFCRHNIEMQVILIQIKHTMIHCSCYTDILTENYAIYINNDRS
jgi:hypothetical protein